MESLKLRNVITIAGVLLVFATILPNFMNMEGKTWLSHKKLNYGLDIQGGLHLVMGVDSNVIVKENTQRVGQNIKKDTEEKNILIEEVKYNPEHLDEMTFVLADASKVKDLESWVDERHATQIQNIAVDGKNVTYKFLENYLNTYKSQVLDQAIETIRNRIDEFGVAEPSISKQGSDRIVVQLPGLADAEKAKQLIYTAAKLEFMIVSQEKSSAELEAMIAEVEKAGNYSFDKMKYSEYIKKINEDLASKLPPKTMIVFEKNENASNMLIGKKALLVKTDTGLGGDQLANANVGYDPQFGRPEVSLEFNSTGAKLFADITEAARGQQMAIVLDKVVKSAPVIQAHITGGRASITLGGGRDIKASQDEAKMIATSLRAGALPVSLEQLEERRVGPSLGSDSVKKAASAGLIGAVLIFIFMLIRYKSIGLISDVTLALNILAVVAILTMLGATLTLPGIAGIALTVGFAVDANVLINERIREELAKGGSFKLAVKEGYSRAASAIIDANVTTAATAVVLLYFGTGPVRGFAVTLLIGIVTTLFANVFVSKVIVDNLLQKFGVQKLSV